MIIRGIVFYLVLLCMYFILPDKIYAQNKREIDSLKIVISQSPKDKKHVENLTKICAYYSEMSNDSTQKYGELLRKICVKTKDKKGLGDLWNYYGVSYMPVRDDSAVNCLKRSLKIRKEIGAKKEIAQVHANLALFYISSTGHTDSALMQTQEAIKIYEDFNKKGENVKAELANVYTLLGLSFKAQDLRKDALNYLEKAKTLIEELPTVNHILASFIYDELGVCMREDSVYEEALCYYHLAYAHINALEIKNGSGNLLRKIGIIYFNQKDYETALRYHLQAEKVLIAEKELSYTGYAWLNLAQDYKALKQNEKVIPEALKAFERGKFRELPGLIVPSATLLAEAYTAQKDFEKALFYTNEVMKGKEILAKMSKENVLNSLIAKYELREKSERIANLNQENNLKNEVLKAQRIQIFAGIGIVLLFMVLGFVLFVNYQRKIKINALLSHQKEELQTLNQVKDRLFSVISHDLRSPINDLFLFLQLNPQKIDISKTIPILSNKVFQVQHLLDNLLQWSVTQMKGVNPTQKHIEVFDLVEEVCNLYQYITDNQEVIVKNEVSENAVAFCDENMLRFVLRNVFTNALKFTPKGKGIFISAEERENEIEISVKDEGLGMNKATLANLFSPNVTSSLGIKGEQGTGLGLMLCKEYVEKNGGRIAIESQEGIGSCVKITLKS